MLARRVGDVSIVCDRNRSAHPWTSPEVFCGVADDRADVRFSVTDLVDVLVLVLLVLLVLVLLLLPPKEWLGFPLHDLDSAVRDDLLDLLEGLIDRLLRVSRIAAAAAGIPFRVR